MLFGPDIYTGSDDNLLTGCLEARRIRNETNRLGRVGWDWSKIKSSVVDNANHVKNTSQLIVDRALGEIETYHDNKDDGWGWSYSYIDQSYPVVMNHGEGYHLFLEDDGTVRFRITATRGRHLKAKLRGSLDYFDRLRTAFNDEVAGWYR